MPNSPPLGPDLGVEIEVTDRGRTARYVSRILDMNSQVICLDLPFEKGRPVALPAKQSATVYLKGEGGLWYFKTRVLSTHLAPQPVVLVPRPAELTRLERRRYARADARIAPTYFMLFDQDRDRGYGLRATILNIGGGGVMFISSYIARVGATVKMAFELPEGYGEVKALGVVVYSRLAREFGNSMNAMGVAFTQISHMQREAIIRFVLYRQAQMARARWE